MDYNTTLQIICGSVFVGLFMLVIVWDATADFKQRDREHRNRY